MSICKHDRSFLFSNILCLVGYAPVDESVCLSFLLLFIVVVVVVVAIIISIIRKNITVKHRYFSIKNFRKHYFSKRTTENLNNLNEIKKERTLHFIAKNPVPSKHD